MKLALDTLIIVFNRGTKVAFTFGTVLAVLTQYFEDNDLYDEDTYELVATGEERLAAALAGDITVGNLGKLLGGRVQVVRKDMVVPTEGDAVLYGDFLAAQPAAYLHYYNREIDAARVAGKREVEFTAIAGQAGFTVLLAPEKVRKPRASEMLRLAA